jgi:TRAP-type C4-dicarboxylate transport system permease small subunit
LSGKRPTRFHWTDIPALVLFVVLAAVVLLQFLSRYILNDSVAWTEEIARYLLIGVAYAGSISALRKGEHIFLEVIYRRMAQASVKPLAILVDLISVAFHAVLTMLAAGLALEADRRMISIDLPKSTVYGFVAVALLAATVVAAQRLVKRAGQDGEQIRRDIEQAAAGEEAV